MEKNKIVNKINDNLKKINYPGFSRDIISFGIVKSIEIKDDKLYISINVNSDDKSKIDLIENEIKNMLNAKFDFTEIHIINVYKDKKQNHSKRKIKKIIAISSCKGGVGKSTIALNLAYQLSKRFKVGLLDLDIYGPSLPTLINHNETPQINENTIVPIEKFGIEFMSFGFLNNENSPTIWRGPMVSRMTQQFFDNVKWGELDYLLLDLPPGTGDIQLTLVQKIALDGAVIITTPQQLSHIDVMKGADMFKKVKAPIIGVIENMSKYILTGNIKNFTNQSLNINDTNINIESNGDFSILVDIFKGDSAERESERSNIPLLGKIALDPNIAESCDNGIPYLKGFPNSVNYEEFLKISNAITTFSLNE